jgi:hypothetical protein
MSTLARHRVAGGRLIIDLDNWRGFHRTEATDHTTTLAESPERLARLSLTLHFLVC